MQAALVNRARPWARGFSAAEGKSQRDSAGAISRRRSEIPVLEGGGIWVVHTVSTAPRTTQIH